MHSEELFKYQQYQPLHCDCFSRNSHYKGMGGVSCCLFVGVEAEIVNLSPLTMFKLTLRVGKGMHHSFSSSVLYEH